MKASWGSQLDIIEAQEVAVMDMEFEENEAPLSDPLTFEEDKEDMFISMTEAEQLPTKALF